MSDLATTLESLKGLQIDGLFLGGIMIFTERDPALRPEQGRGGTFAVPVEKLSLAAIAEARRVQRERFEAAR